jgi:hypothetical protein
MMKLVIIWPVVVRKLAGIVAVATIFSVVLPVFATVAPVLAIIRPYCPAVLCPVPPLVTAIGDATPAKAAILAAVKLKLAPLRLIGS